MRRDDLSILKQCSCKLALLLVLPGFSLNPVRAELISTLSDKKIRDIILKVHGFMDFESENAAKLTEFFRTGDCSPFLPQRFRGLPRVVSQSEYENMPKDSIELYRGTSVERADRLKSADYSIFDGEFGPGIYCTTNKDEAADYARPESSGGEPVVLSLCLAKEARILDYNLLNRIQRVYTDEFGSEYKYKEFTSELLDIPLVEQRDEFLDSLPLKERFLRDENVARVVVPLATGYDGIFILPEEACSSYARTAYYLLWNRSLLTVCE
jgi:hypothetical protein